MNYYQKLETYMARYSTVLGLQELVDWDARVIMSHHPHPHVKKMEFLQTLKYQLLQTEELKCLIADVKSYELNQLTPIQYRNVYLIEQECEKILCVPIELMKHYARVSRQCVAAWENAKRNEDFSAVKSHLQSMVQVAKEIAKIKSETFHITQYEALMMDYIDGFTEAEVATQLNAYHLFYQSLRIPYGNNVKKNIEQIYPVFSKQIQYKLCLQLMKTLGFDFSQGRLDESSHPFCTDTIEDVRITTRYNLQNFFQSLMSVLHESGHAIYRFHLPSAFREQLVGGPADFVMDEAQAILFERMLGRHPNFLTYLIPMARNIAEENIDELTADQLCTNFCQINPSLIRMDADEVTYPLHIYIRFQLERALLNDELSVKDLPMAWNDLMKQTFGLIPKDDTEGCLQDIHWYMGLWGYFPCYSLGAFVSAQLFNTMFTELPDIESLLKKANFSPITQWLTQHIYCHGRLYTTNELMQQITGEPLTATYFMNYIKERFKIAIGA